MNKDKEEFIKNKKNINMLAALIIGGRDVHLYKDQYTKQYYLNYTCENTREAYMKHVAKKLQPLSKKILKPSQYQYKNKKIKYPWRDSYYDYIKTNAYEELTKLRKEFYNTTVRKKIIPETIDNYMSEEFLLWLYLECGYLEPENILFNSYYIFDLRDWDEESLKKLIKSMQKILGIEAFSGLDEMYRLYIGLLTDSANERMTKILQEYKKSIEKKNKDNDKKK